MVGRKVLLMIRKNLIYYRKRILGISLDEMSSTMKISINTLSRLETNLESKERVLYPTIKTLITITDYLKVDIGDFLTKDLEMEDINRESKIDELESLGDMFSIS